MRLADICNPHFKDEHPSYAWLPPLEGDGEPGNSRHPIRFARPRLELGAALDYCQPESAAALTSLSPSGARRKRRTIRRAKTASAIRP
jgi:hypothetical protein